MLFHRLEDEAADHKVLACPPDLHIILVWFLLGGFEISDVFFSLSVYSLVTSGVTI
jgi:hypothetical protein